MRMTLAGIILVLYGAWGAPAKATVEARLHHRGAIAWSSQRRQHPARNNTQRQVVSPFSETQPSGFLPQGARDRARKLIE